MPRWAFFLFFRQRSLPRSSTKEESAHAAAKAEEEKKIDVDLDLRLLQKKSRKETARSLVTPFLLFHTSAEEPTGVASACLARFFAAKPEATAASAAAKSSRDSDGRREGRTKLEFRALVLAFAFTLLFFSVGCCCCCFCCFS